MFMAANGSVQPVKLSVVMLLALGALAAGACGSQSACDKAGGTCVLGSGLGCAGQLAPDKGGCDSDPPTPAGGICCVPCPAGQTPDDGGAGCH